MAAISVSHTKIFNIQVILVLNNFPFQSICHSTNDDHFIYLIDASLVYVGFCCPSILGSGVLVAMGDLRTHIASASLYSRTVLGFRFALVVHVPNLCR
jgi:hypothetical protein